MALRGVSWPRALSWLGLISYSVYLLHPSLIEAYRHLSWTSHNPFWVQIGVDVLFVAIVIAVCSVTYLVVERPMQEIGRRVGRRLDARFGPDRLPAVGRTAKPALAQASRAAAE